MIRKKIGLPRLEPIKRSLMQVGTEVFPVFGDGQTGYSANIEDFNSNVPKEWRYPTWDELYFVLVNLQIGPDGRA